jgi:hypothetical protein
VAAAAPRPSVLDGGLASSTDWSAPVINFAIRTAASFDSAPVVSHRTFSNGSGRDVGESAGKLGDRAAEHPADQDGELGDLPPYGPGSPDGNGRGSPTPGRR